MIIFRLLKIFFKTKLYDYYLSKNSIEEISFTPKDIWPGDPILGDQLVQGYYNLANKKIYSPEETYGKSLIPIRFGKVKLIAFHG